MDSTLRASLNAPVIRSFIAIRIELPSATINLLDGNGMVRFPVGGVMTTFTGSDQNFGTLTFLGAVSEQIAQESPTFSVSLSPHTPTGIGQLCQPENQGSPVHVWFGTVNEATGAANGDPELLWSGRFDTAKLSSGDNVQTVEIDTVSAFDRLFAAEENTRLNGVWHRSIWPGETGLDFVIAGLANPHWGVTGPVRGGGSTVTPGGGGGGGNAHFYNFVNNIANH